MEDWSDHLTQEELNYCTDRWGVQVEHNWICSRWNHHPNFETTEERCLRCGETREP